MTTCKTRIRFYGVRGSVPVAGEKTAKIGGNTSCVFVSHGSNHLILDAGTGIRSLGKRLIKERIKNIHLFFTHFHLDHITGLPFFGPLYQKNNIIHLYGPKEKKQGFQKMLESLFSNEFFPVPFKAIPANIKLHTVSTNKIVLGPFVIHPFVINHPGKTLGYRIDVNKKSLVYIPDHEHIFKINHIKQHAQNYLNQLTKKLQNVDVLIHDAQYFHNEYLKHKGWGHTDWCYPIEIGSKHNIKKTIFFHHDPNHSDTLLKRELKKLFRNYDMNKSKGKFVLANEGMTLTL